MDIRIIGGAVIAAGLAMVTPEANAANEVVFNGIKYRCTNTCVVNVNSSGAWKVSDCCGGRVTSVINSTPPPTCDGSGDCFRS